MDKKYVENTKLFKILSDINRIKIIEMLSCDEICACVILEKLNISQPTLSHHMKALEKVNLVTSRKDGTSTYYTLNRNKINEILMFILQITTENKNCICKK